MTIDKIRTAFRSPWKAAVATLAILGLATMLAVGVPHGTANAADETFSDAQKVQIEGIIKDYLLKNPEIMVDVQRILDQKMETARQDSMAKAVKANADSLFKNSAVPTGGDAKGDVTVVEFFDYNCIHCRDAVEHIGKLIDTDKKVHVVFIDFPIFGKDSEGAARVAIASAKQGKYWEMHKELLLHKGSNTEEAAYKIGEKLGLDIAKLKSDANAPDTVKLLQDNRILAEKLGIQGTPHFIVGEKVIPGAPDNLYDELASLIGDVRKNGCKIC